MFSKSGAPMEADAHFWALLNISFGVPSKGAPLKVPFAEFLADRCPFPRALLRSSFKVSGIWAPLPPPDSRFSFIVKGPLWKEIPISGAFLNMSSRSPVKVLPRGPLHRASWERERERERERGEQHSIPIAPFIHLSKVPGRQALLQVPQTGPLWKKMPVSRAFSTYFSGHPAREP